MEVTLSHVLPILDPSLLRAFICVQILHWLSVIYFSTHPICRTSLHLAAGTQYRGPEQTSSFISPLLDSEVSERSFLHISFKLKELSLSYFSFQEDIAFIARSRWTNLYSISQFTRSATTCPSAIPYSDFKSPLNIYDIPLIRPGLKLVKSHIHPDSLVLDVLDPLRITIPVR
jgi:hypothetical protein